MPDLPHIRTAGALAGLLLERTGATQVRVVRDDGQQRVFFTLSHPERQDATASAAYMALDPLRPARLAGHMVEMLPFGGGWR